MASCEHCKTSNIPPEQMSVGYVEGNAAQLLLGPCCNGVQQKPEVNYHFELSSKEGVVASIEYAGLTLQYRKSPAELRQAFKPAVPQPIEADPTINVH